MVQLKYILGNIFNLPLLPILYLQAKLIRKKIPSLPEASTPFGTFGNGAKKIDVLFIGESTIAGVGVQQHQEGFAGHCAKELADVSNIQVDWKVYAKSGYTAKKVRQKLVPRIKQEKPDLIIVGLGGNDTFTLNSPKQWKQDILVLIEALQNRFSNCPILFANVPPIKNFPAFTRIIKFVLGRHIDLLHEVLLEVSKTSSGVWYASERIELKTWLKYLEKENYQEEDFFSDGVHPSELTYKTWGVQTARLIQQEKIIESIG